MELLCILGIGLILLGAFSGGAIYVYSFNGKIENIYSLAFLFILSIIGGTILYCLGDSRIGIIYSSSILLLLGCISAVTIFLGDINVVAIKNKESLWCFFLVCIPIGVLGIYNGPIINYLTH